jgi:hypothetical protein
MTDIVESFCLTACPTTGRRGLGWIGIMASRSKARRQAFNAALIYVSATCGWILFSDKFLGRGFCNRDQFVQPSIVKGLGFVIFRFIGE